MKFGLGEAVPRVEDERLITGRGRYTDDIDLPGQTRGVVLRSPFAHARIKGIDTAAARAAPGVVAVLTADDLEADGIGAMRCFIPELAPLARDDGEPLYEPPRPLLARGAARFVGDPVAFVVAETVAQAKDAAELVEIDWEELPVASDPMAAAAGEAPPVWPDCPDNQCFAFGAGDEAAVAAAFENAAHTVELELPVSRVAMNPMELRAAVGAWDPHDGRYALYSGVQNPHDVRRWLARDVLGVPENQLRVVSPDMGGGFGMRAGIHPEHGLVLWAARRLGRPVKWTAERSEAFLADDHGRAATLRVALALDAEGRFTALRARNVNDLGAYLSSFGPFPAFGNLGGLAGVYTIPAIRADVRAVFTNNPPTAPYRGAGRPEASFAVEALIDRAARTLGIDRFELRRRNMIEPDQLPYQTALVFKYDSGEFEALMDDAREAADVAGYKARRAVSERAGRLRGMGIACVIESSAGRFEEGAQIKLHGDGSATVYMGTHNHGQGHETVFRQLLADRLGLEFEAVRYVQGDTDQVPYGRGSIGSRSSGVGGAALGAAADGIVEKGRIIAAHLLEAAAEDIEFESGAFTVAGTDRSVTLGEVAARAHVVGEAAPGAEPGLQAYGGWVPPAPTFPNGCHICEVEIDPDTGAMTVDRYTVVDDVGTVMNPMLLKGQIQGGVVQGLGQAALEGVVIDPDSGQVVTGSFMDYAMPRASDVPSIEVRSRPVPSPTNPLGIKGAGEAGSVGAVPCVMSAVFDALWPAGVRRLDMPATPGRVWQALRAVRAPEA